MTAVRDQGAYGTCWAHATYGSMESALLTGETRDFSENNMANWHGGDWTFDDGGNAWLAAAYLARWSGPYNESDDPYSHIGFTPAPVAVVQKHLQNARFLPERGTNYTANSTIKQAILDHGALYCAFYWDAAHYNAATQGFYTNATTNANHAVTIAGWDDNYAAANFNSAPAGNGAFLIKNSWGSAWGNAGYFWISYYDTSFQEVVSFYDNQAVGNYTRIAQYDPLGWVDSLGVAATSIYGANLFNSSVTGSLKAVGFYLVSANGQADIKIYTGVTASQPSSGTLAHTQTFNATTAGYYTVPLTTPVTIAAGTRYSIVVNFTTPGYNWPLPVEYVIVGYSSNATASAGQSFYSSDGAAWTDLTNFHPSANACIKGYLDDAFTVTFMSFQGGTINGGAVFTQTVIAGGTITNVLADPDPGFEFSGWTGDLVGTDNPLTLTVTAPDLLIYANFAATEKVAAGSRFDLLATEVGLLVPFTKPPKVWGTYFDPIKDPGHSKEKKATAKVATKIPKGNTSDGVLVDWTKKVRLYDLKLFKADQKLGIQVLDWLGNHPILDLNLDLNACGKEGVTEYNRFVRTVALACPQIDALRDIADSSDVTTTSTGGVILVKGQWFGTKSPKAWLEYVQDGKLKCLKLKVTLPLDAPLNAKNKPCAMDLDSGASKILVQFPESLPVGTYTAVVIDNGVGLDAFAITNAP